MTDHRDGGSRSAFMGFALVILGGLLFAAGVMVGRQMQPEQGDSPAETLGKIDERDQHPVSFHEELSKPVNEPVVKPKPRAHADAGTPVVSPEPAAVPERPLVRNGKPAPPAAGPRFSLQVASYRDRAQAEQLMARLAEHGYEDLKLVEGEVPGKGTYFRVRAGSFRKREAAESSKASLERSEGLKVLVVREE